MEGKEGSFCVTLQIYVRIEMKDVVSFLRYGQQCDADPDIDIKEFIAELKEPENLAGAIAMGDVEVGHYTIRDTEEYMSYVLFEVMKGSR